MSRVVAVSNRVAAPSGGRPAGGLAVGILGALRRSGGIWFGWGGDTCRGEPPDPTLDERGNVTYATIDINRADFEPYYNGFCNGSLWPLFHYMLGFFRYERADYEAYERVNALFARKLIPLLEPTDRIWVHDYHLIPLAEELRGSGVQNQIGFFLHVPFPGLDVLRTLPGYRRILRALAQYDVVGFQTRMDCEDFVAGLKGAGFGGKRLQGRKVLALDREILVDAFPIGVDVDEIEQQAAKATGAASVQRLAVDLKKRTLVIGVDRLDYSKGLPQRFRAFEIFLASQPAIRGRVVYLQIAPPSRTGVRAYQDIRQELEQAAGHINGRFAEPDWTPVRYLNRGFSRSILMGFFRLGGIGLVTPLRDGMNLVAKEFVAAQDPEDPGVLVLSRLAGAAAEFGDSAVLVNPFDAAGVADALLTASEMQLAERRERHAAMMEALRRNDIHAWRRRFIDALTPPARRSGLQ